MVFVVGVAKSSIVSDVVVLILLIILILNLDLMIEVREAPTPLLVVIVISPLAVDGTLKYLLPPEINDIDVITPPFTFIVPVAATPPLGAVNVTVSPWAYPEPPELTTTCLIVPSKKLVT